MSPYLFVYYKPVVSVEFVSTDKLVGVVEHASDSSISVKTATGFIDLANMDVHSMISCAPNRKGGLLDSIGGALKNEVIPKSTSVLDRFLPSNEELLFDSIVAHNRQSDPNWMLVEDSILLDSLYQKTIDSTSYIKEIILEWSPDFNEALDAYREFQQKNKWR